jgi:hypothetical protein
MEYKRNPLFRDFSQFGLRIPYKGIVGKVVAERRAFS